MSNCQNELFRGVYVNDYHTLTISAFDNIDLTCFLFKLQKKLHVTVHMSFFKTEHNYNIYLNCFLFKLQKIHVTVHMSFFKTEHNYQTQS